MNLLSISLSAATFAKGDRIIARAKKDEWYTGTVKRFGAKLYLDFDDGATATVESKDFKWVKLLTKDKAFKRALDDAQMEKLTKPVKTKKADAVTGSAKRKPGEIIRLTHNRTVGEDAPPPAALAKVFKSLCVGAKITKIKGAGRTAAGIAHYVAAWPKDAKGFTFNIVLAIKDNDPTHSARVNVKLETPTGSVAVPTLTTNGGLISGLGTKYAAFAPVLIPPGSIDLGSYNKTNFEAIIKNQVANKAAFDNVSAAYVAPKAVVLKTVWAEWVVKKLKMTATPSFDISSYFKHACAEVNVRNAVAYGGKGKEYVAPALVKKALKEQKALWKRAQKLGFVSQYGRRPMDPTPSEGYASFILEVDGVEITITFDGAHKDRVSYVVDMEAPL